MRLINRIKRTILTFRFCVGEFARQRLLSRRSVARSALMGVGFLARLVDESRFDCREERCNRLIGVTGTREEPQIRR